MMHFTDIFWMLCKTEFLNLSNFHKNIILKLTKKLQKYFNLVAIRALNLIARACVHV